MKQTRFFPSGISNVLGKEAPRKLGEVRLEFWDQRSADPGKTKATTPLYQSNNSKKTNEKESHKKGGKKKKRDACGPVASWHGRYM